MHPIEAIEPTTTHTLPTLDDCLAEGLCLTCCRELTGHGSYCSSRCARVATTTKQRWLWSDEAELTVDATPTVQAVVKLDAFSNTPSAITDEIIKESSPTKCAYCGDKAPKSCTRCRAIVCTTCCDDDGHCPSCNDPTLVLRTADFVYLTDAKLPAEIHLHGDSDVTVSDGAATSGSTQHFDGLDEFCEAFGISVAAMDREIEAVRAARAN